MFLKPPTRGDLTMSTN